MVETPKGGTVQYEAPALVELGAFQKLTLECDKKLGSSDGFTFMGLAIVCASN